MSASIVGGSVNFDRRVNNFEVGRDQRFVLIWRFRIVTDYSDLCRINAVTDTPNMQVGHTIIRLLFNRFAQSSDMIIFYLAVKQHI